MANCWRAYEGDGIHDEFSQADYSCQLCKFSFCSTCMAVIDSIQRVFICKRCWEAEEGKTLACGILGTTWTAVWKPAWWTRC